ncbi:MAG: hypothetical protein JST63_16015 [Bacteroidetes bacterium]|nr:hypothetical protein [Bacteroidota bacterium]
MSDELEQFYSDKKHDREEGEVVTKKAKKSKKRKPESATDEAKTTEASQEDELRKRARFYVKSPEQWRVVCKYPAKRLEEFVQEKDFENKKEFQSSVLDGFHQIMASGIDRIANGDGHVREQILADVSLRKAIEEEGADFVQFFSNKVKIAVLSFLDIANGKREQYASGPRRQSPEPPEPRIEEESGDCDQDGQAETQAEEADAGTERLDLS